MESPEVRAGKRVTEEKPAHDAKAWEHQPATFELEEIRTISFRCEQCQTVVRFPRIRWARSPESCPNCGARWMRRPSAGNLLPEDRATYVFQMIFAFREALQALAGMGRGALFTLILEADGSRNHEDSSSTQARQNSGSHT